MIRGYRDLKVWAMSLDLACDVFTATRSFPREERFGLSDQLRRASASVPANIAEGHGRFGPREYLHHLSIASGSLKELETLLLIAERTGILCAEASARLLARSEQIGRMLTRLRQRLRGK